MITPSPTANAQDVTAKHTPGPWATIAQGGSSTVVAFAKPKRNDTRIPGYGYAEEGPHCVGYPFIDDDGQARRDFVCFSHDDARLIAAAPDLLAALQGLLVGVYGDGYVLPAGDFATRRARAAIAKATAA